MVFLSVLMIFLSLYQSFNTFLTHRIDIFRIFASKISNYSKNMLLAQSKF